MENEAAVLAIETSGKIGSVALGFGDKIVSEKTFSGFMRHSAEILPAIEALLGDSGLKPDQVEQLYISNGPGSFTGLRISATIAKMMYLANQLKIVAVDSLDVTAFNALDVIKKQGERVTDSVGCAVHPVCNGIEIKRIAAIIDAKRGQFFIAVYNVLQNGTDLCLEKVVPDSIMSSTEFIAKIANEQAPLWLLGDGLLYHRQEFQAKNINILEENYWSPRARAVYLLGRDMAQKKQFADPVNFKPFYLYRPEIVVRQR
jgi:tRNA threonylcarbamoyladenosine biosynthesis protein TsaB